MIVEKRSPFSLSSIISVASILFYCVGFIRVELEMNAQKKRISALEIESVADQTKRPSNDPHIKFMKNAPGKFLFYRNTYRPYILDLNGKRSFDDRHFNLKEIAFNEFTKGLKQKKSSDLAFACSLRIFYVVANKPKVSRSRFFFFN